MTHMTRYAEVLRSPLSNFAPTPVTIDGTTYPTTEHYFQAMKSIAPARQRFIALAPTPAEAKRRGRAVPLRPDWESVKEAVMLRALRAKFAQNPRAREHLLATGGLPIRESAPWDGYWGTGRDGCGLNRLGELLMQVREEARRNEARWAGYEPHPHTCTDGNNSGGDGECLACGERDCPSGEPLHYHHDGCPECTREIQRGDEE